MLAQVSLTQSCYLAEDHFLQITEMMHSIREAFDQEVAELPWIDNITRPAIYDKV